uniref:Uncharacterized protein n=1 Tax=Rhodosorus marinus TaxID=101924 RepID=A0A7S2ZPL9_9RHOD|mmetsp:Transcript_27538/g.107868  ORF Transcript_27538/g.107868 Transcript_27538/m.107868 type:complete len:127 (+) Transcript_27538:1164-1544(+)|eukprot:CAMPEP_0113956096 /NCGR_PEP_ID=MMETSP0011_2-20120614/1838_1 /TAXON_ID=101924 /ORGANISM="Rhodosorus marinus" /LENGTH=126 /DNA_ID=CAMNT_0000966137 /DNA_START=827 /DNA_END=1207 /DNA_ORIENTATION=- /assembly_acc=CAM_ASM_000156
MSASEQVVADTTEPRKPFRVALETAATEFTDSLRELLRSEVELGNHDVNLLADLNISAELYAKLLLERARAASEQVVIAKKQLWELRAAIQAASDAKARAEELAAVVDLLDEYVTALEARLGSEKS